MIPFHLLIVVYFQALIGMRRLFLEFVELLQNNKKSQKLTILNLLLIDLIRRIAEQI